MSKHLKKRPICEWDSVCSFSKSYWIKSVLHSSETEERRSDNWDRKDICHCTARARMPGDRAHAVEMFWNFRTTGLNPCRLANGQFLPKLIQSKLIPFQVTWECFENGKETRDIQIQWPSAVVVFSCWFNNQPSKFGGFYVQAYSVCAWGTEALDQGIAWMCFRWCQLLEWWPHL